MLTYSSRRDQAALLQWKHHDLAPGKLILPDTIAPDAPTFGRYLAPPSISAAYCSASSCGR